MPRRILGLVVLVFFAAACSEQGETVPGPTSPSSPTVTSVTVAGSLTMSNVGLKSQMSATAHYAKGTTEDVTTQATWSSSDANIATVSGGLVTSVGVGTVTITATFKTVSGATRVTVTRPPAYALSGVVTESVPHTSTAIAGVRVEILDGAGQGRFALTDAAGRYQMADVSAGTFNVRASVSGYSDASKQVALAANSTLDFALVPTLQQLKETFTRTISGGDFRCYSDYPCQVIDVPLHNTGPLTARLSWTSDADLGLQLYNADNGLAVETEATRGVRAQSVSQTITVPGNYQLRVFAMRLPSSLTFIVDTTHTN